MKKVIRKIKEWFVWLTSKRVMEAINRGATYKEIGDNDNAMGDFVRAITEEDNVDSAMERVANFFCPDDMPDTGDRNLCRENGADCEACIRNWLNEPYPGEAES